MDLTLGLQRLLRRWMLIFLNYKNKVKLIIMEIKLILRSLKFKNITYSITRSDQTVVILLIGDRTAAIASMTWDQIHYLKYHASIRNGRMGASSARSIVQTIQRI